MLLCDRLLSLGLLAFLCAQILPAGCAEPAGTDMDSDASTGACPVNGTGGTVTPNPVVPTVNGTVYTFTFGNTVFAVDAALGGRIVTFSLAGKNILTTAASGAGNNYGSTFWPSPQTDWGWPPPAELDPGAYTASLDGSTLSMTSAVSAKLGLSITKKFSVDGANGVVTIDYGLVNNGTAARLVAPWEISRVVAGGITFFPMGEGTPTKGSQALLNLQITGGVAWFPYNAALITSEQKVFADGHEGWIAHTEGNLLLVKAFSDTAAAQAAPGESEIEIYTDAGHTYIEIENQGAYASLATSATSTWTVRWFLRQLDAAVSVQAGSNDLVCAVRALVKG